mgnify:CR=1 FL=1
MSIIEDTSEESCPEIVKPTVDEACPECEGGYIPSNCVLMSEAIPYLRIGKGKSITNALTKVSNFFQNIYTNLTALNAWTHEKNKDSQLEKNAGYMVYTSNQLITVDSIDYELPSAKCQFVAPDGTVYTSGVEDATALGAGVQALLYAFNPVTKVSFGIRVTDAGEIEIEHSDNLGVNAKMVLGDGFIKLQGLPTASAGLTSNEIWNDGGTLKIIP